MKPETDAALYDRDFNEWVQFNVDLLRRGCVEGADIEHIVEELEGLANRDQRAVENRLVVLVMHLLKWKLQPDRRYSRSGKSSWLSTILEQRRRVAQLLQNSPSLKPFACSAFAEMYPYVVKRASAETGIPIKQFPGECPFSLDQVLDQEFLPE
jgi:Domain of unknown function DUF29